MSSPILPNSKRIKTLLDLPAEARAEDVFQCVMGCLTDALECEFVSPIRLPGKHARYKAAWVSRDGTRYQAEGHSDRDATLAAALRLISEAKEAVILRSYSEPELKLFDPPKPSRAGKTARRVERVPSLRKVRHAGCPE